MAGYWPSSIFAYLRILYGKKHQTSETISVSAEREWELLRGSHTGPRTPALFHCRFVLSACRIFSERRNFDKII